VAASAVEDLRLLPTPERLNALIRRSDERNASFLKRRNEAFREAMGRFWGAKDVDDLPRVMNLMQRGMTVLVAQLAAVAPMHELGSKRLAYRTWARKHQIKLDQLARETNRVALSRLCIVDALLGNKAIVRSGSRSGGEVVEIEGRMYNKGQPYHRRIDPADYIIDPAARCREEAKCEGDRYRISRREALESGLFNPDLINEVPSLSDKTGGEQAAIKTAIERAATGEGSEDDYAADDLIELVDLIWYGDTPLKVTLSPYGEFDQFLRVQEFEGPDGGPYSELAYYPIPGQVNGLPPGAIWREQNDALRGVLGKWLETVGQSKKIGVYNKANEKDANTVREAQHGAMVGLSCDPSEIDVKDFGLVSPELAPIVSALMNFWSVQSGSLDQLGGTGSKAGTATEFQGLMANANQMLEDFVRTQEAFEADVSRHDLWYLTYDPFIDEYLTHRIPGMEDREVRYSAAQRQGDFNDFNLTIKPRSMLRVDQAIRARRVIESMTTLGSLAPVSTVMGGPIDLSVVARVLGRELDIDEMDELVSDPVGQMLTEQMYAGIPFEGQGQPMGGARGQAGQAPGAAGGMGVAGRATTSMGETRGAMSQRGAA